MTSTELECTTSAAAGTGQDASGIVVQLRAENASLFRRLSDQEKFNIASRRSLCEQSDRYLAERDTARARLKTIEAVWSEVEARLLAAAQSSPTDSHVGVQEVLMTSRELMAAALTEDS